MITIKGLYYLVKQRLDQILQLQREADRLEGDDPQIAHDKRASCASLIKETQGIEGLIESDITDILSIEAIISVMEANPHKSAHRTLALRALEIASGHLRRELGDKIHS